MIDEIKNLKNAIKNKDLTNISWETIQAVLANPNKYCLTFGEMMYLTGVLTDIARDLNSAAVSCNIDNRLKELETKTKFIDSQLDRLNALENRLERIGMIFSGEDQW